MDPTGRHWLRRPSAARRAPGGTFSLAQAEAPQAQSAAVGLRTLGGIDALIALQGIEDPAERRRRAVKHGRRALDALDELKVGLLAGTLDQATMLRLKSAAADLHDGSGTIGSTRFWPKSTCGWRSNWPKRACPELTALNPA